MVELKYEEIAQKCFFCGLSSWVVDLSEHHLWPGVDRKHSPTIYLCFTDHQRATNSNKFRDDLKKLYKQENNLTDEDIEKILKSKLCKNDLRKK